MKSGYPKINVTRATNATRVRPEDYSTDVTTSLTKPTKGKSEVGIIDFKIYRIDGSETYTLQSIKGV